MACLTRDTITVVTYPDSGFSEGQAFQIPLDSVPPDLRKPNAEFDLLWFPNTRTHLVLRKGEPNPRISGNSA